MDFAGTRSEALMRLEEFSKQAAAYAGRRNFVEPGHPAVSRLSPAIRHRLILEEEAVNAVLGVSSFGRVEKWIQEVLWRTYWKGWLEMRPEVWTSWRQRVEDLRQSAPDAVLSRAKEVAAGRSGVAVMDHFAQELISTGYLHNHARMWWASFWIHVERLPWELGADVFFQHLLDADPASNTLSWRWVAGLQTPGKTYLVRLSNLENYCSPELLRNRQGLERVADESVRAQTPEIIERPSANPLPPVAAHLPGGRVGWWIHEEDCAVEYIPPENVKPVSVAGFAPMVSGSDARREFTKSALHDAMTRAAETWDCDSLISENPASVGMTEWIETSRLDAIVAYAPPVGPLRDALPAIQAAAGTVPVTLLRRSWDQTLFPFAKSGYFPFWQKLRPRLMDAGGFPFL
jgi:deoxyribodipyrimidine photo-lyase